MGDVADGVDDAFQDPKSFVSMEAALGGFLGPVGTVGGATMDAQKRSEEEQAREDQATADAKQKADAEAKAAADAKAAAEAAQTEEARRQAELRLARRTRAMTTSSDTTDSARLRLG